MLLLKREISKLIICWLAILLACCSNNTNTKSTEANPARKTVRQKLPPDFIDLLFADQTISEVLNIVKDTSIEKDPIWASLASADKLIKENRKEEAIIILQQVLNSKKADSRTTLVTWNTLREIGIKPQKTETLGLVLEVPTGSDSIDILGMYSDKTARYINKNMSGVIWETHEPEMDKMIETAVNYSKGYSNNLYENGNLTAGRNRTNSKKIRLYFLTTSGVFYIEKTWEESGDIETPFGYIVDVSSKVFSVIVQKCAENQ